MASIFFAAVQSQHMRRRRPPNRSEAIDCTSPVDVALSSDVFNMVTFNTAAASRRWAVTASLETARPA
jgi:hypothetical protein